MIPGTLEALEGQLRSSRIEYEVVEHAAAFTSIDEARAAGLAPHEAVKTLLLNDRGRYSLAVVPVQRQLDERRAREVLHGSGHLRLATEDEMAARVPVYEVGALPPFGPGLPDVTVMDVRVLEQSRILCAAGDHRHSLLLDPGELERMTDAIVADICERDPSPHHKDFGNLPRV